MKKTEVIELSKTIKNLIKDDEPFIMLGVHGQHNDKCFYFCNDTADSTRIMDLLHSSARENDELQMILTGAVMGLMVESPDYRAKFSSCLSQITKTEQAVQKKQMLS